MLETSQTCSSRNRNIVFMWVCVHVCVCGVYRWQQLTLLCLTRSAVWLSKKTSSFKCNDFVYQVGSLKHRHWVYCLKRKCCPSLSLSWQDYLYSSGCETDYEATHFALKTCKDDCIVIHVPFSFRGIGKQGFQCQGKDKLYATAFFSQCPLFLI